MLRFVDEVANGRNLDAVDELLSDDFALPPGGGINRDGLKAILGYYFAAFPDLHYDVQEVVAEGDNVSLGSG